MGSRAVTNTLLITDVPLAIWANPRELISLVAQVTKTAAEMVLLPKFGRILLICESEAVSSAVASAMRDCEKWNGLKLSYTLRNNKPCRSSHRGADDSDSPISPEHVKSADTLSQQHCSVGNIHDYGDHSSAEFLELPLEEGLRRFLISPPASPPDDWNYWDKQEDHPHPKPVYAPEELTGLLWTRLGGTSSSLARKYREADSEAIVNETSEISLQPRVQFLPEGDDEIVDFSAGTHILFQDRNSDRPVIMIDYAKNRELGIEGRGMKSSPTPKVFPRTAMPPS